MQPIILLAFANERHGGRYLDKLPLEQARLREALEPAVEAGLCELVVLPNATVEDILDTFQKARYKDRVAIFHYAGHADGYQLLLESRTGGNVTAHGSGVVSFLGKQASLKLIFLNGCSTQQQAEEMVEAGVPAVVGTSVSIADDIALNLAVRFYTGLGGGASLERAWREAQDEVKMRTGGKGNNFRSLYWEGMNDVPDVFPWNLYIRPGSEIVQSWNLPDAVSNPLFGLPEVPRTYPLPDEPYIFLRRFERRQAEIFFGRSYYIRELYNRITDPKAAHVISLYGQSGVGKSSLFDAGLNPRLEGTHEVYYIRRDQTKGLLNSVLSSLLAVKQTLTEASPTAAAPVLPENHEEIATTLKSLRAQAQLLPADLAADLEKTIKRLEKKAAGEEVAVATYTFSDAGGNDLNALWRHIEFMRQRPLVIILDQVEELFTRPNPEHPHELNDFLTELRDAFIHAEGVPQGKMILGYRKEYFAEIEEGFKQFEIQRSSLFLEHLAQRDIVEVVNGLASHPRLTQKYNLTVEPGLGEAIAADLLEDKDSPIAPVLQILLTKMWQMAKARDPHAPKFRIADYEQLRKEGILMDDFFKQQIDALKLQMPDLVESGLVFDILMRHTTRLGTAETRTLEDLRTLYTHRADVLEPLLTRLNDLYLLTGGGAFTGLAHDTLAPVVQHTYRSSDSPGQRAARLIENKAPNFDPDNLETALDENDLAIVEKGYAGMRVLSLKEQELLIASQKRRDRAVAFRRRVRVGGIVAVSLIALGFVISLLFYREAEASKEVAKSEAARAKDSAQAAKIARDSAFVAKERAVEETKKARIAEGVAEDAKAEAERKRELAEKATQEAFLARKAARDSALVAESERRVAESARNKAEEERVNALRNAWQAEKARYTADSTFYLAKAKELAIQSQILEATSEYSTLRKQLAWLAYRMHIGNAGPQHDADIYDALNFATTDNPANRVKPLGDRAEDEVAALTVLADGQVVASARNGKLRAYRTTNKEIRETTLPGSGTLFNVLVAAEGYQLMLGAGAADQEIYIFDWVDGSGYPEIIPTKFKHQKKINEISISKDHKYAVSCSDDGVINLWNIVKKAHIYSYKIDGKVTSVAFCRNNSSFACAYVPTGSKKCEIIELNALAPQTKEIKLCTYENTVVLAMAANRNLSPSGAEEFAVGTNRGAVHVYQFHKFSSKPEISFAGHLTGTSVTRLAFSRDGSQLLSAGTDGTVRLWDRNHEKSEPMQVARQEGFSRLVAFTQEGSRAVSAGDDKKLYFCELTLKSMAQPLEDISRRKNLALNASQWAFYVGRGEVEKIKPDTVYPNLEEFIEHLSDKQ